MHSTGSSTSQRAQLQRKLQQLYPAEQDRKKALSLLQRYGASGDEPEPDRVRLAILKLAGKNLDELKQTVAGAREDWEDIVDWAERPRQTRCAMANRKLHEPERLKLEREDSEEWTQWLD